MKKAVLFDLAKKKGQQIREDSSMTPSERIDRMFELMELYASLHPSKTLLYSNGYNEKYIVLKKKTGTST